MDYLNNAQNHVLKVEALRDQYAELQELDKLIGGTNDDK